MILGGDFRQVLPVVPHGTKCETIGACILKSEIWRHVRVLRLKQNMRAQNDVGFSEFFIRVGDGIETYVMEDLIKIPESMLIPWLGEDPTKELIDVIFPELSANVWNSRYMIDRALLTPENEYVDVLNERVIYAFQEMNAFITHLIQWRRTHITYINRSF